MLPSNGTRIFNRIDEMQQRYCDQHNNGSAKVTFLFNYEDDYLPVKERCRTSNIVMDNDYVFLMGFNLERNSDFYEVFFEAMMRIVPAGIPQKLHRDICQTLVVKLGENADNEPKVLTLDDLGFGFIIFLCACGVSSAFFVVEVAVWLLQKMLRKRPAARVSGRTVGRKARG